MEKMVFWFFQICAILVYVVSGGILFHQLITVGIGMEVILLGPIFITASIIGFVVPVSTVFQNLNKYIRGIVLWFTIMSTLCILIIFYDLYQNRHDNVLICQYSWDGDIEIFFRDNYTFKTREFGWLSGSESYGNYKVEQGKLIITSGSLHLAGTKLNDTLTYDVQGLHFTLEEEHKGIHSGIMQVLQNRLY